MVDHLCTEFARTSVGCVSALFKCSHCYKKQQWRQICTFPGSVWTTCCLFLCYDNKANQFSFFWNSIYCFLFPAPPWSLVKVTDSSIMTNYKAFSCPDLSVCDIFHHVLYWQQLQRLQRRDGVHKVRQRAKVNIMIWIFRFWLLYCPLDLH